MDQVIGIMIVIVVIGLLADKIFFLLIEKFLHRRWKYVPGMRFQKKLSAARGAR